MLDGLKKKRTIIFFYLVISVAFILYVTLLTRLPTLTSTVRLVPFWSYSGKGYIRQALLNIALFIPLGYFLSSTFSNRRYYPIIIAFAVSVCIELLQYITCRGILDVDDLISNIAGAAIGIGIYRWIGERRAIRLVLLAAEIIGCIIVDVLSFNYTADVRVTEQFDFEISSVIRQEDTIQIVGCCGLNNQHVLDYRIVLAGREDTYKAKTIVQGDSFVAIATGVGDEKYEVQVQFKGHKPMTTKTWINGSDVQFVPEIATPEKVKMEGVLKAYNPDYDTFVYVKNGKLIWLIGWDLDASTEIICHVHTNEPEKLPESRVLYGYENRGFRIGSPKERESLGKYKVFEDLIPNAYNVTAVVVGFKTDGKITWTESFRVK